MCIYIYWIGPINYLGSVVSEISIHHCPNERGGIPIGQNHQRASATRSHCAGTTSVSAERSWWEYFWCKTWPRRAHASWTQRVFFLRCDMMPNPKKGEASQLCLLVYKPTNYRYDISPKKNS